MKNRRKASPQPTRFSKADPKPDTAIAKSPAAELPLSGKISAYAVPTLFFIAYFFLWFGPAIDLQDPWREAYSSLSAADAIQDPSARQRAIDDAGARLKGLSELHPYHARVHYFLGAYYNDSGQYDPAIAQAKEAIRLGSGTVVNRVDLVAQQLLVAAVLNKSQSYVIAKDYATAQRILSEAYDIPSADKAFPDTLGGYFEETFKSDPKHDEFYYLLGAIASSQKRIPSAITYLEKSLNINPGLTAARDLLSELKQQSSATNH